jgi:signal transduction histidine kinase
MLRRPALALVLALLGAASAQAEQQPLTEIRAMRTLTRAQAAQRPAVLARGVVTFKWTEGMRSFCIQDDTLGIWVSMGMAESEHIWAGDDALIAALRPGSEVEVEGVMDPGGFAPNIAPRRVRLLGSKPLPPPRTVALARLLDGAEDAQRVEVAGVVQRCAEARNGHWLIHVDTGLGRLLAHVPVRDQRDPARLVDAEVLLRGVAESSRNWRAEYVCPRMLIAAPDDVVIERAAPADPFAVPLVGIDGLATFSPDGRTRHRRRIAGTVTHQAGAVVYLQEGRRAVRVGTEGEARFAPGDRVEAAGFIDTDGPVAGLRDAVLRRLGGGAPPAPVPATLAGIQAVFAPVRRMGRPASPHDYDGLLVAVSGRLLSVQRDLPGGGRRLVLDCDGSPTLAELAGPPAAGDGEALDTLLPGSLLKLSGVALVHYAAGSLNADYQEPQRLDLLLRDARDVAVLQAPSWWTPQRLGLALAATVAVLLASLAWTLAMRRLLRLRTTRLEEVMRRHRDSEIEFKAVQQERRRLAADMHDGLQQLLAGAAFRLEAAAAHLAEVPPAVQTQLTAARSALLRTQDGLRDCLWGLRQVEDGPGGFAALLEHAAASMEHWPRGGVTVAASGRPFALSRHVMGSLLMLMQEAAGNAFRHGQARQVRITLAYDEAGLEMRIADDGAGFDPQSAPGTRGGHFGLESMRHRTRWLGGTIEIASTPGAGATVVIRLPRAKAQAGEEPAPPAEGPGA